MKLQVKIEDQVFDVVIDDLNSRPIRATVDGDVFEVWPEETEAEAAPAAPAAVVSSAPRAPAAPRPAPVAPVAPVAAGGNSVVAPLPGVITGLKAKPGDTVKQGQEIVSLEAMKMNNAIRAPRNGKVAAIHVAVGDHVKHGQALFDIGD